MHSETVSRLARGLTLLTVANPKIMKGIDVGYATAGLHLSPANESGYNTCANHSAECAHNCIYFSGYGNLPTTRKARINRTIQYFDARHHFLTVLRKDLTRFLANAQAEKLTPVVRLNLTSDIRWENHDIPQSFPTITFYDYTKLENRKDLPSNYTLVFSFSGTNLDACRTALANGMSVAVPFRKRPATWLGYPTIDGDLDDLRFLHTDPVIIGLSPKGRLNSDPKSLFLGDNHPAAA